MKSLKRLLSYLLKYKGITILIIIFSLITTILNLITPLYIGKTIDEIVLSEYSKLIKSIITLVSIYLIIFISESFLVKLINKLEYNVTQKIREDLFKKITTVKIKTLDSTKYGEIINKFSVDISNISNVISNGILKCISGIITVIFASIIMIKINITMSIIVMISAPIIYYVSRFITNKTNKFFKLRTQKMEDFNGMANEFISNEKTITDFAYNTKAISKFNKMSNELQSVSIKTQFFSSLTNPITRYISHISYITIGVVGVILLMYKKITIGNISSFLLYTNTFSKPFNEITAIIAEIQQGIASAEKIFEFLDEEDEKNLNNTVSKIIGNIEFKNVFFSYNKSQKFIENLNLKVNKGEVVAIVGKTGAGKTTIANLLLRLYDIDSGKILIDGKDIYNYDLEFLRKNIGIVLQDTKLFTATVKENIAYGKENVTDEQIINVAKIVHADEFINKLPNGYNTIINNESMLSLGEIQLINIARILLLKPPIVVLDEATSNIDLVNEINIQNALLDIMKSATTFVIAHRLSTIKNADKIIFIENGNIVEEGTHNELMNKKGKYYELYQN
mgnify:CR=1 FL=1